MNHVTLVTGGGRSGKSRYAQLRAMTYARRVFLATATPFDDGMLQRIARHQDDRGESFVTVEEPLHLDKALRGVPPDTEVVLIDCLTVWLGNLMHEHGTIDENAPQIEGFLKALRAIDADIIIVTNEVGMGIIPDNAMARDFRDIAGLVNQRVATAADDVILVACGIPLTMKSTQQDVQS